MTIVPLSKGLVALIDDEDAERVLAFKWTAAASPARRGKRYAYRMARRQDGKKEAVLLHRFILNAPKGVDVDHRDNDGLNCQRFNLRLATRSQNNQNMKVRQNSSGFKGVYFHRTGQRPKPYSVQIKVDGKIVRLGYYRTAEEAARAYDSKARELFGQFACVNFGGPHERSARA